MQRFLFFLAFWLWIGTLFNASELSAQLFENKSVAVFPYRGLTPVAGQPYTLTFVLKDKKFSIIRVQGKTVEIEDGQAVIELDTLLWGSGIGMAKVTFALYDRKGGIERNDFTFDAIARPYYLTDEEGGNFLYLYENCANIVKLQSPWRREPEGLVWLNVLEGPGAAKVIPSKQPGKWMIVPKQEGTISYEYGAYRRKEERGDTLPRFDDPAAGKMGGDYVIAVPPPTPDIKVVLGDSFWTGGTVPRDAELKVYGFGVYPWRNKFEKDSRYIFQGGRIFATESYPEQVFSAEAPDSGWGWTDLGRVKGRTKLRVPVYPPDPFGMKGTGFGFLIDMTEFVPSALAGKRYLVVYIGKMLRVNFQNRKYEEPLSLQDRWVILPLEPETKSKILRP